MDEEAPTADAITGKQATTPQDRVPAINERWGGGVQK